ncbi:putative alpha-ketoglutarate-dependent sulfonate dioxygenase [Lachnellula willkommii]|uniref:Putative alpha-ketoglutarate-dependent sulfonate dioxygenase n=1 Tax=Lachnellula willkommii TaxID=215461 RepID=A0A559M052_9HELO|nr:putative alpha-ketoglutarate-dependent sulfonate dioxygenase [Lachnellula willkommii]
MPSPSEALLRAPLTYSHTLDDYESFDVTGPIGREFPKLQLSELLKDDAKIKDLAILASQRGALFFRGQDISNDQMKDLGSKLGELTNKPPDSKLHRHALSSKDNVKNHDENGKTDEEVFFVSSVREKENHSNRFNAPLPKLASYLWHSDISFEHIPADYGVLKMAEMPNDVGGDTIFACAYEMYDRMSPYWQKLCDGLTATHFQPVFSRVLQQSKDPLITENRGHPENTGLEFSATHPVVRTNPVTGWKHLFAAGQQIHDGKINGVTDREEEMMKQYFLQLITENHDLQCRFKWGVNDVVVWDNRSTFHSATNDYNGKRKLIRITSIGEKPYLDPNSLSRAQALKEDPLLQVITPPAEPEEPRKKRQRTA